MTITNCNGLLVMALFLSQSIGFNYCLTNIRRIGKKFIMWAIQRFEKKGQKNSMSMVPFVLVHHYFVLILWDPPSVSQFHDSVKKKQKQNTELLTRKIGLLSVVSQKHCWKQETNLGSLQFSLWRQVQTSLVSLWHWLCFFTFNVVP